MYGKKVLYDIHLLGQIATQRTHANSKIIKQNKIIVVNSLKKEAYSPQGNIGVSSKATFSQSNKHMVGLVSENATNGFPEQTIVDPKGDVSNIFMQAKTPLLIKIPDFIFSKQLPQKNAVRQEQKDFEIVDLELTSYGNCTLDEVLKEIESQLEKINDQKDYLRPLYLYGERLGGLLALNIASKRSDLIDRIVVTEPWAEFQSSPPYQVMKQIQNLDQSINVAFLPYLYYSLTTSQESTLTSFLQIFENFSPFDIFQFLPKALDYNIKLIQGIPRQHSLEEIKTNFNLAKKASYHLSNRYDKVQPKALILARGQGQVYPQKESLEKLAKKLPYANLRYINQQIEPNSTENIVKIIKEEEFYLKQKNLSVHIEKNKLSGSLYGSPNPIERPSQKEIEKAYLTFVKQTRDLTGPVFISQSVDGSFAYGLKNVPDEGPVIFVGNHPVLGMDASIPVSEISLQKNYLPRPLMALADQVQMFNNQEDKAKNFINVAAYFGGVQITPLNMVRLLSNKESLVMYPGGTADACHFTPEGQPYVAQWPQQQEFVAMAARYNATIVPMSMCGIEENFTLHATLNQLSTVPLIGPFYQALMDDTRTNNLLVQFQDRYDTRNYNSDVPIITPKNLPQRFYYLFGKPISTEGVHHRDREALQTLYDQVKHRVENGVNVLKEARLKDPNLAFIPRKLSEASSGFQKQAPTVPLEDIKGLYKKYVQY